MFRMHADVDLNGPPILRRGDAARWLERAADRAERAAADQAKGRVVSGFNAHIRHQTPIYVPGIHVEQRGDAYAVTDRGQVYNYWLEGEGSRNFPVTSFRGYYVWRDVGAMVPSLFHRVLDRTIGALARRLS